MPKQPSPQTQTSTADQLLLAYEAEKMRRSLKRFILSAWPVIEPVPFIDGWVVDALADHLTAITFHQFRFLLITIPPRHSKSTIASVLWPIWSWLHRPEERYLCSSFNLDLAIRDNFRKREMIRADWFQKHFGRDVNLMTADVEVNYQKAFGMSAEQDTKRFFMNDHLGYQLACSVGGSVTGQGGSVLVCDDPHSADEAHSKQLLDIASIWFREVWSNRMNNPKEDCMVVVGQRIHTNDVPGLILRERTDWVHLNLPAEYDPKRQCVTPLWRDPRTEEGELLWEERFNMETIARYKRDLGRDGYSAQYLMDPVPEGGAIFRQEWVRFYKELPEAYVLYSSKGARVVAKDACWLFGTMDLAISTRETADYTVAQIWAVTPQNDLLLIHQVRDRLDNPSQQKLVRHLHMRYGPEFWVVESVGYQLSLIQQLRNAPIGITDYYVTEIGDPDYFEREVLWKLPNIDAYILRADYDYRTPVYFGDNSIVRVLGDTQFFEIAMSYQGYGVITGKREQQEHAVSIPVREYKPHGRDKVMRASTPAILMENEQYYFPEGAPFVPDLITELLQFPRGSHDDQVDALGQAGEMIAVPRAPLSDEEYAQIQEYEMKDKLKELPETTQMHLKPVKVEVDPFQYADMYGLWSD